MLHFVFFYDFIFNKIFLSSFIYLLSILELNFTKCCIIKTDKTYSFIFLKYCVFVNWNSIFRFLFTIKLFFIIKSVWKKVSLIFIFHLNRNTEWAHWKFSECTLVKHQKEKLEKKWWRRGMSLLSEMGYSKSNMPLAPIKLNKILGIWHDSLFSHEFFHLVSISIDSRNMHVL